MNYDQWNKLLRNYYFNEEARSTEVYLGIDEDSLKEYIQCNPPQPLETALSCVNKRRRERGDTEYSLEEYALQDFFRLFNENPGKENLLQSFGDRIQQDNRRNDGAPTVFPYLVLFIMPLANNPTLRTNNYYNRLQQFLRVKRILNQNETINTNDLTGLGLRNLWTRIDNWAQGEGYCYHGKNVNGYAHIGRFLGETILTATQRKKFKNLFYQAGLVPHGAIEESEIGAIMSQHYQALDINQDKWTALWNSCSDLLVGEFRRQYRKWEGDTDVNIRQNGRRVQNSNGNNYPLYLVLMQFRGAFRCCLRAWCGMVESGTCLRFVDDRGGEYEFTVQCDGYADRCWDPANNWGAVRFSEESTPENKLIFSEKDFYCFEQFHGFYTSKCKLQLGGQYYVLVKEGVTQYESWLKENQAEQLRNTPLPNYNFYKIASLQHLLQADDRGLRSVVLEQTFHWKIDNRTYQVYNGLPVYFEIEGVGLDQTINAVVDYEGGHVSKEVRYDADNQLWKLPVLTNRYERQGHFRLFCQNEQLGDCVYQFSDFNALPDEQYEEICYNKWGSFITEENSFNGLSLPGRLGVPDLLSQNMQRWGRSPQLTQPDYKYTDYILYWLSSQPRVDKKAFSAALAIVANGNNERAYDENLLLYNYCRLGYINYAYRNQHILAINKPTMILIPSPVERRQDGFTEICCKEKYFKVLLTGARTPQWMQNILTAANGYTYQGYGISIQVDKPIDPLYPQRVLLWSESIDALCEFARSQKIKMQRVVYSDLMLRELGSVGEYLHQVQETNADYTGVRDREEIDYQRISTLYQERGVFPNKPTKRGEVNAEFAVVTYNPGKKYNRATILWREGRQYPIEREWGHFIGASHSGAQIVDIVEDRFKLPKYIHLPMLYARALTMITGEIPTDSDDCRVYQCYSNPCAPATAPAAILSKLGQNNR